VRLHISFTTGKPVYQQLVDQVKTAAATGALRPGEPLPSIRPLAEELRVNRNTVARAYAELERAGVIVTVAGKGCFLGDNHSPYKKDVRVKLLTEAVDAAVVQAHHLQVDPEEFRKLVESRLARFESQRERARE